MIAKIFLYIFGLLWLIYSIIMIFAPAYSKKVGRSCLKIPIWFGGIVSVGFAILLWYSASASLSPTLVKAISLLSIWKGLFLLLAPIDDLKKTTDWWFALSDLAYRILGILFLPVAIYFILRIV